MKCNLITSNISSYYNESEIGFVKVRAGNPHSTSISSTQPTSIKKLASAKAGSGHDCFLKGFTLFMDLNLNKIEREQLLRYRFVEVISSCSIMHNLHAFLDNEEFWVDVPPEFKQHYLDNFKVFEPIENSINKLPMGVRYPISIKVNMLTLKTIKNQRTGHKLKFWKEFLTHIEVYEKVLDLQV